MTVVSDAGPLIALAKIGGLETLSQLYPRVLVAPAVYREAVEVGLDRGDPDAEALRLHAAAGKLVLMAPRLAALDRWQRLGAGERESIRLAIEHRADWLLLDDAEARQMAADELQLEGLSTQLRGTLGVIVTAHREGWLGQAQAIEMVERIRLRPDIWISARVLPSESSHLGPDPLSKIDAPPSAKTSGPASGTPRPLTALAKRPTERSGWFPPHGSLNLLYDS